MSETYWWLSFADGDLPEGQQFLGVVIASGPTFEEVVTKTHQMGINPGGEIQAVEIPAGHVPPNEFHDRLLSRAELEEADLA